MDRRRFFIAVVISGWIAIALFESCTDHRVGRDTVDAAEAVARRHHEQEVMRSGFCARCHPVIYAEHEQNTHGRAFTDAEVRLATGRFSHGDCIICHAPRPIFETGIGMNPVRRHHGLEDGNSCMTCHWQAGYDYGGFDGGAECKQAFDPRVGQVEACASCHRNHGTPYQWELAAHGKAKGKTCISCHMSKETRPVAVGMEPRRVRSHVFPGGRSPRQLRRAYSHSAEIDGSEVVVKIENSGVGHNFPTELKQRSLESLVVVRDESGKETARSRMVFRDPYKRPYGLKLPVNTQIPSGQTAEHRVPINIADGTVDVELHYKLYFPIEDHHPDLSHMLEKRRIAFDGVTPSNDPIESAPEVKIRVPEAIAIEAASPPNLVDFAKPLIGKVDIDVPAGDSTADIEKLIELFQFPVLQGNVLARERLAEIGTPAVPQLIEALGSWDNKTWNQAMTVLEMVGAESAPEIVAALSSDQLYVRLHGRELLARMGSRDVPDLERSLRRGLTMSNAIDRSSAIKALADLGYASAVPDFRAALRDRDPDVVRVAAMALAEFSDDSSIEEIRIALKNFAWDETRRDLSLSLAQLGDAQAVSVLIEGLDHGDDLIRESFFEALFSVTGLHQGYDPMAPRPDRLEAIAAINRSWVRVADTFELRPPRKVSRETYKEVWLHIKALGGGDGLTPGGDDETIMQRLVDLGESAVLELVQGLKYPPGFAVKRAHMCNVLGRIKSMSGVPALVAALRDPVVGVGSWACWALGQIGDRAALSALQRYDSDLRSMVAADRVPAAAGHPEQLLAHAAGARLACGEARARTDLALLLLSKEGPVRLTAIQALERAFGETRGYAWNAPAEERQAAAARWLK